MAFNHSEDDDYMADINVTPLVDVMLVLLILFMITMPVLTHSIPLELPTTATGTQQQQNKSMRLVITSNGEYFINEQKKALEDLAFDFEQEKQQNPDLILAIVADKLVSYDYIAKALNAAKLANLTKVGFVTEPLK